MDPAEAEKIVEDLAPRIERLRALYEQYFMGIGKMEPSVFHKKVDRTIWSIRRTGFRNTRLRFKFQQLVQRYNTYQQYWKRILRQIEAGTYRRHVLRAAKNMASAETATATGNEDQHQAHDSDELDAPTPPRGFQTPKEWTIDEDEQPTPPSMRVAAMVGNQPTPPPGMPAPARANHPAVSQLAGGRPLPPPQHHDDGSRRSTRAATEIDPAIVPASAQREAPRPLRPPPKRISADEQQNRQLYEQFVSAKRAAGESTAGMTYERLSRSLEKQTEKLSERHAGKKIAYEVVTKNGKTLIRPVIK
jgi:hypothetical protein